MRNPPPPKVQTSPKIVFQDETKPVPKPILAEAIVAISEAMEKLTESGLNKRAVVALIQDQTGLPKNTIHNVLDSLKGLKEAYCR